MLGWCRQASGFLRFLTPEAMPVETLNPIIAGYHRPCWHRFRRCRFLGPNRYERSSGQLPFHPAIEFELSQWTIGCIGKCPGTRLGRPFRPPQAISPECRRSSGHRWQPGDGGGVPDRRRHVHVWLWGSLGLSRRRTIVEDGEGYVLRREDTLLRGDRLSAGATRAHP
jgi:hypothetical protein